MDLERAVTGLIEKLEGRYFGKYRAIVVDNDDPERLGRLRIRIPSLLGTEVVSGWAAPCLPYGGDAGQGWLFIPEVGAGVWVEFEEGDLEFPIWVGTYWSKPGGESELPKPNAPDGAEEGSVQSPPTRKIIKTAAGHTLQLEDAEGEELLLIQEATHNHRVVLNGDGIVITEGQQGHEITLDGSGVTLKDGAHSHEIVLSSQGVTIEDGLHGQRAVLQASGLSLELSSGAKVELTPAGISIDAVGGIVQIKGSMVRLGPGALPVIRIGDQGIGNLGAPVPITISTNTQVLA